MDNKQPANAGSAKPTLSAEEFADLQAISDGKFDDDAGYGDCEYVHYMSLWNKKLIARRHEHTYVTDLGKQVLGISPAPKASRN